MADDLDFPRFQKNKNKKSDNGKLEENKTICSFINHNTLVLGSTVLGIIDGFRENGFLISLPFHLVGYLDITHVVEENVNVDPQSIFDYYTIGKYVCCVVLSVTKSCIELSIRPSLINAGYQLNNLKPGMWISCTIDSLEDYGFVGSLGSVNVKLLVKCEKINNSNDNINYKHLIVNVGILNINIHGMYIDCTTKPDSIYLPLTTPLNLSCFHAGLMLEGKINSVIYNSTNATDLKNQSIRFYDVVTCRVFNSILPEHFNFYTTDNTMNDQQKLKIKQNVHVRVITYIPSINLIIVSSSPNVLKWQFKPNCYKLKPGITIMDCKVVAIDSTYGAKLSVEYEGNVLFVDLKKNNVSDDKKMELKLGQIIPQAKVISYSAFDDSCQIVTASNLLNQKILMSTDLDIGQIVEGKVKNETNDYIIVSLYKNITGFISKKYGIDNSLKDKNVNEIARDGILKCCVISISRQKNVVWLSIKKCLLELKQICSDIYLGTQINQIVTGVVGKNNPNSNYTFVHFFNNVCGKLPRDEFIVQRKENKLQEGSVVHCRVLKIEFFNELLALTLNTLDTNTIAQPAFIPLLSNVMKSYTILQRKYPNGCSLANVFKYFEEFDMKDNIYLFKRNITEDYVLIPSLKNSKNFLSSGLLTQQLIAIFGPFNDHFIVLFAFKAKTKKNNATNTFSLEKRYNDDEFLQFSYSKLNNQKSIILGIGFVYITHFSDDISVKDLETKTQPQSTVISQSHSNLFDRLQKVVILSPSHHIDIGIFSEYTIKGPLLSFKQTLISACKHNRFLINYEELYKLKDVVLNGYITKICDSGLSVSLGNLTFGGFIPKRLCSYNIDAGLQNSFHIGQTIELRINEVPKNLPETVKFKLFIGTMMTTLKINSKKNIKGNDFMNAPKNIKNMFEKLNIKHLNFTINDFILGYEYCGIVKIGLDKGVFVYLNPSVQVRIKLSELPESPICPTKVKSLYYPYKFVKAVKITEIKKDEGGLIQLEGSIKKAGQLYVFFEHINVGNILAGRVKNITEKGLAIHVESSDLVYFCHLAEIDSSTSCSYDKQQKKKKKKIIADDIHNLLNRFSCGDRVAVYVKSLDSSKMKAVLSMKQSYFKNDFETLQDKLEKIQNYKYDEMSSKTLNPSYVESSVALNSKSHKCIDTKSDGLLFQTNLNEEGSHNVDLDKKGIVSKRCRSEDVSSDLLNVIKKNKVEDKNAYVLPPIVDIDDCSTSCLTFDEETILKRSVDEKKLRKREKRQLKAVTKGEDRKIHETELSVALAEKNDDIVETPQTFERLLISRKSSSYLWIRYMAYYLRLKDLEKARSVAEQAVETIIQYNDEERYNVWVAYLNMESYYGTDTSFDAVLKRATVYNDPQRIYLQTTYIFQKKNDVDKCIQACRFCVDKFPMSKKTWIRYITCLYECQTDNDIDIDNEVKGITLRAMKSLPLRKHVSVVTTVGRLEMKYGSIEKGISYFEKLIFEYPKRTDIWCQYFDCLVNAYTQNKTNILIVRNAFQKACNAEHFKPRQMKFLFTRWLNFEKIHGDLHTQEMVQQNARLYVEKIQLITS